MRNCFFSLFFIFPLLFFVSCSTDSILPPDPGTSLPNDLEDVAVNRFNSFKGYVYASTDSGLYRRPLADPDNLWTPLGLQDKEVVDVVFLPGDKLLAGIDTPSGIGAPSLFLSTDGGQHWQEYLGNYGGGTGKYTLVNALATLSKPSDTLLASGAGQTIPRSTNGGKEWKITAGRWDNFGGLGLLVAPDAYYKNRVWAGGVTGLSTPYLFKSNDKGKTWSRLNILKNIDAVCYDVATYPSRKNVILAGLGGTVAYADIIRKSTDGGETWQTVHEGVSTLTFTHSARNPEVVYASGRNPEGTLFFMTSHDFGDTWQQVALPDSPPDILVKDMISVMKGGHEVLYFGTNQGLYSYTFEK